MRTGTACPKGGEVMQKEILQAGECIITQAGRIIVRLPNDITDGRSHPVYEIWAGLGKVYEGSSCQEGENHSYLEGSMKQARSYDNEPVTDCDCGNRDVTITIENFCSSSGFGQLIYRKDLT